MEHKTLGRMRVVMFPLAGSIPEPYFSIFTLGSCQHKPGVGHIIPQVHVGATAQDLAALLEWDVGFYGNSIGTNHRPVCSSLTLDFPTLRIPGGNEDNQRLGESFEMFQALSQHLLLCLQGGALPGFTLGKGALGVLPAIAVRIASRIDSLKADPRSGFRT